MCVAWLGETWPYVEASLCHSECLCDTGEDMGKPQLNSSLNPLSQHAIGYATVWLGVTVALQETAPLILTVA